MADNQERIAAALKGAKATTDPVAIWRDKFAGSQMPWEDFCKLESAIAAAPEEIVRSLLETRDKPREERFQLAQPHYVSVEEFRAAWVELVTADVPQAQPQARTTADPKA